jgi:periplasmic protein TonB
MSAIGSLARWGACCALVLCGHAVAAGALLAHWSAAAPVTPAGGPLILVTLAPAPAAPEPKPTELPPAPVESQAQPEAAPKPVEQAAAETQPIVAPEVPLPDALAVLPPARPVERPPHPTPRKSERPAPREHHASIATAAPQAERRAAHARTAAPGPVSRDPDAVPNWRSHLVAQIERYKDYPAAAKERGDQGDAEVAFSVDRHGGVHRARLVRGTGSTLLDRDALAWVARAAPLPPPPPEMAGALIPVVVPLRYHLR